MSDDLLRLRAGYAEAIRKGRELCTVFQNYYDEVRRLAPEMSLMDIVDFLNRG